MKVKKIFDVNPFAHISDEDFKKIIKHWDKISGLRVNKNNEAV